MGNLFQILSVEFSLQDDGASSDPRHLSIGISPQRVFANGFLW